MKQNKNYQSLRKFMVYGINGSTSVLASDNCYIEKILLSKNHDTSNIKGLKQFESYINVYSSDYFKKEFKGIRSQGIVIFFRYEIYYDLPETIGEQKNECYLILDSIKDPQNFGQIIRTSECAGVSGIIIPERRSVKINDTVLQVSQGAFCNIKLFVSKNIKYSINILKENRFWVTGIENSIDSKKWFEISMNEKSVFIFGSEAEGLRTITKKYCDNMATIPMLGKINSLNVSASVSAILFERNRQLLKNK